MAFNSSDAQVINNLQMVAAVPQYKVHSLKFFYKVASGHFLFFSFTFPRPFCKSVACLWWILSPFSSNVSVGLRPCPCRADRSPSLTRAPLLSPDGARAKWGLGHVQPFIIPDQRATTGGRKDLGSVHALSFCCLFLMSTVFSVDVRIKRRGFVYTGSQAFFLVRIPRLTAR